jgi:hypothetical protein
VGIILFLINPSVILITGRALSRSPNGLTKAVLGPSLGDFKSGIVQGESWTLRTVLETTFALRDNELQRFSREGSLVETILGLFSRSGRSIIG